MLRLTDVIIDCPDTMTLASFYSEVTGRPVMGQRRELGRYRVRRVRAGFCIGPNGSGFRVYTDPVGHPFCLCRTGPRATGAGTSSRRMDAVP